MEQCYIDNPRYPHHIRITRHTYDDNPFAENTSAAVTVLYDGCGRSFTDTTTDGGSNVEENKRKASIPVRYDEWGEGLLPMTGDKIEVFIGKNRETGIVKDCEPDNGRTLVYWIYRRV